MGVPWHTGAADELNVARPGPGRTPAEALELVRRHGATHTSAQLAQMLNAAGLTTGKGKPFTAGGVAGSGTPTRSLGRAPSPSRAARSASSRRLLNSVFLPTPSTTGCGWGRCPPAEAPVDAGASLGTRPRRRSTGRRVAGSFRLNPVLPARRAADESESRGQGRTQ
jgi:hypothetical protein